MLPQELIPTRLVRTSERSSITIRRARRPSRFRTLVYLYRLLMFAAATLWLRFTWQLTPADYARYVRKFLLSLGTVWIKLGQTLAMRSDLLSVEFAAELATLRDLGTGVPFGMVKKVIEKELGAPVERLFDEFGEKPFTATTSFQLHRARLRREQVWVAVKVLRPYVEETLAGDLALLRRVTRWLHFLGLYPKMRWLDLCREVEEASTRELDLRFEAAALAQLAKTLPPHGIYVPEVFSQYSSQRILTMEFIHAVLMADFLEAKRNNPQHLATWLEENNVQPRKVAQRLFHSIWRQVLEDNFFHADMHPGNVILLRNNRLAVIDCRSAGQLEMESLAKHRRFVEALADGDYATAAEFSFLVASRLPRVDLGEVKDQFVRVWRRWENRNFVRELPSAEKSLTRMLHGLNRIMFRYGFEAQWSMVRLAWTVVNADVSIMDLASDVNYLEWLRQYFRTANKRRRRVEPQKAIDRATVTLASLLQLPKTLSAISIAQQEILRRQARVFQGTTTKSSFFLATLYSFLGSGLLLIGGYLTCGFLDQHFQTPLEGVLGPQLTTLVRFLPSLSFWLWAGVLLLVAYFYRRTLSVRRAYLKQDLNQRPDARPAI